MKTLYFRHNEDDNIIILCIMHNHNNFDRVFVDLSRAIFILCVSLLAAWSLIAELYLDLAFFLSSGVRGGGGGDFPAANISKTIRYVPIKFSQIDGTIKLNIRYTFVVMPTNCDVIMA